MTLPYSDPSNPALPSPLFSDVTAVRNDHMRANNAAIFADLEFLNDLFEQYFTDADQLTVDEILEKTPDAGVTIDGLTIKDGAIAEDLKVQTGTTTARLRLQTSGSGITDADGLSILISDSFSAVNFQLYENFTMRFSTSNVERLRLAASTPQITVANNARDLVNSSGYVVADKQRETGAASGVLNTKIIEIGDWNMDSTASVAKAHGLTYEKIISVRVTIREDSGASCVRQPMFPFFCNNTTGGYESAGYLTYDSTNIYLFRTDAGGYNNPVFDSTSYNRGWIIIEYID